MTNEEEEAYLRKHTFNGQVRELQDATAVLAHVIRQKLSVYPFLLKLLDMLGI